jgi:MFS family permease
MAVARHDALAALRQPSFALYSIARFCFATSQMMLAAAVSWQVYALSGSAFQLGLLGLLRFLPALTFGLVGGAVADSFDRRRIGIVAQALILGATTLLLVAAARRQATLGLVYATMAAVATAQAFEWPARVALLPLLVSRETLPSAIVVSSTIQQLAFVIGPALAGGAIALAGVALAYAVPVALVAVSIGALGALRPRAGGGPRGTVSLRGIREGLRFVWHRQVLLGAMTLDLFAVIFGGATALLPIYARDILRVGPLGYGMLYASLDFGALLMAVVLLARPPIEHMGRALMLAVLGFGGGTIVFGLSHSFTLSLAAYMFIGMADQVSVVMRQTMIQLATPDALRGRVSSVNMLFIGASNQLGAVESGFVAAATSAVFSVVSGGAACLAVLGLVVLRMPELRRYRGELHREA